MNQLKIIIKKDPAVKINEPYVYIANHQNSFDVITICKAALPGVVTIGKKSLKWIPIFGQIYWLSGNIMIDRKNSGKARNTLDIAAKRIAFKHSVELSSTTMNLRIKGLRSKGIMPAAEYTCNAKIAL